jgi:hypothetical protein
VKICDGTLWLMAGLCTTIAAGCADSQPKSDAGPSVRAAVAERANSTQDDAKPATPARRRGPITLGASSPSSPVDSRDSSTESVFSALQPLQVLLGKWNGTSRKAAVDQPEWVWDFQTDREQPALALSSEKGEYLRAARLTYVPERDAYELTAEDGEGRRRLFSGTFIEPVRDVPGDDDTLQRRFKLQFTESELATDGEIWQLVFAQQENDRYILEVNRKRGGGPFTRIDTVHTQRQGTSFAVSSTDYGEKTCIISQGLGTIPVSYKGASYWVCCTGCKAAFEEDPERWIARYEERKKTMKK